MLAVYLLVYAYLAFFSRKPFLAPKLRLDLFWSYREAFDGFSVRRLGMARQILLNILVYIPLGIILAALFRQHSFLHPFLIGFSLSVGTEMVQYIARIGVAELDDVLDNGMGLIIGILMLRLALKFSDSLQKSE